MAIAFTNAIKGGNGFSNHIDLTVPGGGWASGSLVVVNATSEDFATDISNVTDTRGNSYTNIPAAGGTNGGDGLVRTYYSVLATTLQSGDLVTVTAAAANGVQAIAAAFTGTGASPLDQSTNLREGSAETTPHSSGSVTTTQADELLVGCHLYRSNGTNTWTPAGSFTVPTNGDIDNDGYVRSILQYKIVSSTGSYDSTGTTSGSVSSRNCISTFKASLGVDTGLAWIRA